MEFWKNACLVFVTSVMRGGLCVKQEKETDSLLGNYDFFLNGYHLSVTVPTEMRSPSLLFESGWTGMSLLLLTE
jgi:hypothetical protein